MNNDSLSHKNAVDFWPVLPSDRKQKKLLLYAKLKLTGKVSLEFCIDQAPVMRQTATFRLLEIWDQLYWYAVWPFPRFIFKNMIRNMARYSAALTRKGRISF